MTPEAAYFLKVNAGIALFYAFYRLFFYKDTFFRLRRIALLAVSGMAFLYPLFDVRHWVSGQLPVAEMVSLYSSMLPEVVVGTGLPGHPAGWVNAARRVLVYVYLAGAAGLSVRFLLRLGGILALSARSRKAEIAGTTVYLLERPSGPFSFFRCIFIYPAAHTGKELEEILLHETTHVRQGHSFDVILFELLSIVCWMNPFIWLLKREVRHNLEYLADRVVLQAGHDSKTYQYHLLALAYRPAGNELYNNFSRIHLKNRISMMNKARSRAVDRVKYLIFIPLTGTLTLLSNIEALARPAGYEEAAALPVGPAAGPGVVRADRADEDATGVYAESYLRQLFSSFLPYRSGDRIPLFRELPERAVDRLNAGAYAGLTAERAGQGAVQYKIPDEAPYFSGGETALSRYISRRLRYPAEAAEKGIEGRVICSLAVDAHGRVTDVQVERGADPLLDAEALRVIALLPDWTPGRLKGVPVSVRFFIPVSFKLQ